MRVNWANEAESENMMTGHIVDFGHLPHAFPTHQISSPFWEWLGRAIGTYGFLEDCLARAVFALSATKEFPSDQERDSEFDTWAQSLEQVATGTLSKRIDEYEAVLRFPDQDHQYGADLVGRLRKAAATRNMLVHSSWEPTNDASATMPRSLRKRKGQIQKAETAVGIDFLQQTQRSVAELATIVISTVSQLGIQFPGSNGPGVTLVEQKT